MLKTRVIPCLTIKEERLVKSVRFEEHRNIGSFIAAVRVFNARDVDELVFLDLDAKTTGLKSWLLADVAKECFMPLTVGGGIRTVDAIRHVLRLGADKVSINTAALERPAFIDEASAIYGSQCVVISIDVRSKNGGWDVFGFGGRVATGRSAVDWAKEAELRGAGEILLTSIDRDGLMEGYDVELVNAVSSAVRIPVIASGGAGRAEDFVRVIQEGGASATAAASIFQYTQTTPKAIRQYLAQFGIDTRL